MNSYAIFQQAQKTLDRNPNDAQAQFTVDLWNASKNLSEKNVALRAEVDALKAELAVVNAANATYARNQDMLESKLGLTANRPAFDAGSWLSAQLAVAAAAR